MPAVTSQLLLWLLFFATTIYGHVGMKLASQRQIPGFFQPLFSAWGFSALIAWFLSAFLWAAILARAPLAEANSISALRHVLICLAAFVFLNETLNLRFVLGSALICAGIILAR
jgi:drug/metabolite transporter (DMT)-like permease